MSIYGLLIGLGIVFAIDRITKQLKDIKYIDFLPILLLTLIFSRLLFVLHNIEEVRERLINPLAVYDGGLTIYGALVGLLLALFLISKYRKINFLKLTDTFLLYVPLIQAIGRWGNYFNKELYGVPTTLPWGIHIPLESRVSGYEQYETFHPVFFYESVLNLLNFLLLRYLHSKRVPTGTITSLYLILYSGIRITMNMLRIDKEYFVGIETSDLFSLIALLVGLLLLIYIFSKKSK